MVILELQLFSFALSPSFLSFTLTTGAPLSPTHHSGGALIYVIVLEVCRSSTNVLDTIGWSGARRDKKKERAQD